MKKRLNMLLLAFAFVILLTGCAKLVSEEEFTQPVIIIKTYYRATWVQPVYNGKFFTVITHPAEYEATIETPTGVQYTLYTETAYDFCKGRGGMVVLGVFTKSTYDDETVKIRLKSLSENDI